MRTSSQLRRSDECEFNPRAKISLHNSVINLASAQKRMIKRILMGEPVENIRAELANDLDSRGHIWENLNQKEAWLSLATKRVERFIDFELNSPARANRRFPEEINNGLPIVVDYKGEPIETKPDYVVETEDSICICKVKTGRAVPGRGPVLTPEAYCFGLYGEQLNQIQGSSKNIVIEYLYLGDPAAAVERETFAKGADGKYLIPYDTDNARFNKITEAYFDDELKEDINKAIEKDKETHASCTPEDCAGCSMNNVCHYEEPPIPAPASEAVRPVSDVHLSNDQRNVVTYDRGISHVNAGPGTGKTLVALMCMLIAIDNGYQACIMAPTEILATQHYNTISKMLDGMDVKVRLLTGSSKKSSRDEIHESLEDNSLNILIGTHALI